LSKKAFVIGHPIAHSRSPLIHGTWLAEYGVNGSYEAIDVSPDALPGFFERLRAGEFAGGNVTIPHKEAVFVLCDHVDDLARKIGAVNTLIFRDGKVHGTNTDYLGFLGNLDAGAPGWDERLENIAVLGAGGAARAIIVALQNRGVGHIHLFNRTLATAVRLAEELGGNISAHEYGFFNVPAPVLQLVVNTSAVGMHGTRFDEIDLSRLPNSAVVTDIVYTPLETPLLADAKAQNLRTVDGLGMLLHQAVPGFAAWFGVTPQVTPQLRARVEATLDH